MKNAYSVSLFLAKQLASQNMFVVRYSLTVVIVSQKYRELSMQVENRE
jgi:hypothetical protein